MPEQSGTGEIKVKRRPVVRKQTALVLLLLLPAAISKRFTFHAVHDVQSNRAGGRARYGDAITLISPKRERKADNQPVLLGFLSAVCQGKQLQ